MKFLIKDFEELYKKFPIKPIRMDYEKKKKFMSSIINVLDE
jgi:hypothetical protein